MANQVASVDNIVARVANYENVAPDDLPPLQKWIDSDTWKRLTTGCSDQSDSIEFSYIWYSVTIHPDGKVTVAQSKMAD